MSKNPNQSQKPNVLVIVSEDHSQHLGCYGAPEVQTPHLDALAARGVRFANHHTTQAICSPGRASILTGLYPHQNGQIGLASQPYAMYQPYENLTSILKRQGYRTGIVGKLHVNPADAFPFDYRWNDTSVFGFNHRNVEHANDLAANFMADSDEPFFMYVAYPDAHLPLLRQEHGLPEKPLTGDDVSPLPSVGIDTARYRDTIADYYNCMSRLDTAVGSLLARLEKMGKAENTLVVFTTDHGMQLPRGKCHIFEQSLRVPWIMHHPMGPKGRVVDELTSHVDILPTLLDILGIDDQPPNLFGSSIAPLVRGEDTTWRDYVVGEWNAGTPPMLYPQRSIRVGRYKYILSYDGGTLNLGGTPYIGESPWGNVAVQEDELAAAPPHVQQAFATMLRPPVEQLYDLERDPHEFVNLADRAAYADTRADLRARLDNWQRMTHDYIADPDVRRQLAEEHAEITRKYYPRAIGSAIDKNFSFIYPNFLEPKYESTNV